MTFTVHIDCKGNDVYQLLNKLLPVLNGLSYELHVLSRPETENHPRAEVGEAIQRPPTPPTQPAPKASVSEAADGKSLTKDKYAHKTTGRGTREWTPEQRAAQAERSKGQKKAPFDNDLDAVKADFDAGMPLTAIGRKWGCSEGHIRNFLSRHGIDPRRGSPAARSAGKAPMSDDKTQTIIEEKAKGTPSKVIGDMIDMSQHAVDVKYSQLKKAGLVPESHLSPETTEERKKAANALRAESMRAHHAERLDGHAIEETAGESEVSDDVTPNPVPVPSTPHRLTVAHPGYAGKREDGQLVDSDWPDIKEMLARGKERRAIASDYDVDLDELDFFIASCQRREKKQPPGEARAPLPGLASGA